MKKIFAFICLFFLLFSLYSCKKEEGQIENSKETSHTHTYSHGICDGCQDIDESYCSAIYEDLTYKMRHMESYVDVIEIKELIDSLPDSYRDVATISSEYDKIYSLFQQIQDQHLESLSNMLRDDDEKVIIDYSLIKSCFSDLLSLERLLDCNWSIKPPLLKYFKGSLSTWACGFFKGYYSNTDDYYWSFIESNDNGLLLKTNIPWNFSLDTKYSWTIEDGDIYFIPEGSDSKVLAFKIHDFTEDTLQIYCYKNTTVYTLYYHPVGAVCNHNFKDGSYCLYCSYYKAELETESDIDTETHPETEPEIEPETEPVNTSPHDEFFYDSLETEIETEPELEPELEPENFYFGDVVLRISKYGDSLTVGTIVSGLFVPCSEKELSGTAEIFFPINDCAYIVGIDSFENFYIQSGGNVTYNFDGAISRIGSVSISYNYDGTISRVGTTSISYNFDDTISRVGTTSISHNFDDTISRIGTTSISYNFDDTISRIGTTSISYNFDDTISRIGTTSISYNFDDTISRIGTTSISYNFDNTISRIGGISIYYNFDGTIQRISN